MKELLRTMFSPILKPLERGDADYVYKPMNRKILLVVGVLFGAMSAAIAYLMPATAEKGYLLPVIVFGLVALVALVVGLLGSERAVAKIWGSR